MRKHTPVNRLFLLILGLSFGISVQARHIAGGEMSYTYLGPGTDGKLKYLITLRLYRDCFSTGAALDQVAFISVFARPGGTAVLNLQVPLDHVEKLELTTPGPCIYNAPDVCYQVGVYFKEVQLAESRFGYDVTYQRCCRIEDITNIVGSERTGATYTAAIPGTDDEISAPRNSSPRYNTSDTIIICENNFFVYNFSAYDDDGDNLSYEFDQPFDGGADRQTEPKAPQPPPYDALPYSFGYSYFKPMGDQVSLNQKTGIISGIAPQAGIYVVTVTVTERRNGKIINGHRKDLHIKVAPCTIAAATLKSSYISCDGFTMTFRNLSNSPLIKTFDWDFGIPGATSTEERPTFTYPDTGVYKLRLITNKDQDCSDTAYSVVRVFPGFAADYDVQDGCKNVDIKFTDKTTAKYGVVDSWQWSFGHPSVNPNGSELQNPTYSYPDLGTYQTQLIVTSSKGCIDTVDKVVNILNKPGIKLTNDTLICNVDTLQLHAAGNGSFTWSPNVAISDLTSPDPYVSPDVPTKYYVTLVSAPGCVNTDSVFVNVKNFVTLSAGPDTTICLTDTVRLKPISDALGYQWSPSSTLSDPNVKNPVARPPGDITYTVVGSIGKCTATDAVTIRTVPYPTTQAWGDTSICYGDVAQIHASGGIGYRWTPATGLNDNRIPEPTASPEVTTRYLVAVFDNKGCPKPSYDSVTVVVIPPVPAFAGNDTAVVVGQPLQFNATGGSVYTWVPARGLNRTDIPDPVANLTDNITYYVKVATPEGCYAMDSVQVKVFKTPPDIFVPTAFTPNGDELNDKLTPIPVGVSKMDYFRIYDRWGKLVFATDRIGVGWDGTINGMPQGSDTFAWVVRGTDYTGRVIAKKGVTTLIR